MRGTSGIRLASRGQSAENWRKADRLSEELAQGCRLSEDRERWQRDGVVAR